jgi:hypothetical protein
METPNHDTWPRWTHHAKHRHLVKLNNGWVAELIAVHRATRSCRVRLRGRHYNCWVEDIAYVGDQPSAGEHTEVRTYQGDWHRVDPWGVVDLDQVGRAAHIRSGRANPSKSWLTIIPDPSLIPT